MTPTGNYIRKATDVIYSVDLDIMNRDTIPEPIHLVQYDSKYQVIRVALWKDGEEYTAPANSSVNIRYLKPDHTYVYNPALGWDITISGGSSGTTTNPDRHVVFLEVTQEMTTFPGKARFIVEIVSQDGLSVIGTASLDVIIDANPVQEDGIESSSEFKTLIQYTAEAEASKNAAKVSETNAAKSAQNAKTSETKAKTSETNAKASETNAKISETNAKASETNALASKNAAATSASKAKTSETNAKTSETNAAASAAAAKASEDNALASERKAKTSETNAKTSETNAANSANAASTSATNAAKSAQNAKNSETNAESYMTTAGESAADALASEQNAKRSETNAGASAADALVSKNAAKTSETKAFTSEQNAATSATAASVSEDNAEQFAQNAANSAASALASKNAAESAQNAANTSANNAATSATAAEKSAQNAAASANRVEQIETRLQGTLHAMGTVTFANLPDISEAHEGDMYNISDEFTTTSIFKDGSGKKVPAGSNVYKTADGYWDVLAGTLVSSVNGQTGNVEIDLGTVDGILPVVKGGTGKNTARDAFSNLAVNANNESADYTFKDDDRILWAYAEPDGSGYKNAFKTNIIKLVNYIKTKLATVATSGSYNDLSNKPTTMKNPKALSFTGGVTATYDGSAAKSVAIPTTLPANGGTAQTISETLPIAKGGTGQTTAKDAMKVLANSTDAGATTPTDDDWYLAQWAGGGTDNTNVVRRKTSSLWNYIKAKCNALYLQLSGGTMTGTISSSKTTVTFLKGSQGEAIINSTAAAGAYTALSKLNSTNGFFTDVVYQKSRQLIYMAKTTVDAGTNSPTKQATLLDESGNSSFPGTVTAPTFKGKLTGNADTATKLGTANVGAVNVPIYLKAGVPTEIGNCLRLKDGTTSINVLSLLDDGDTANHGGNFIIQGKGNTFIGSGESPEGLYNQFESGNLKSGESYAKTSENFYLTADTNMFFYAGAGTIANRAGLKLTSVSAADAYVATLTPLVNELANLGTAALKFHEMHAATFHGNLAGNATTATTATKLENNGRVILRNTSGADQCICISPKNVTPRPLSIGYGMSNVGSSNEEDKAVMALTATPFDTNNRRFLEYTSHPMNGAIADMLLLGDCNAYVPNIHIGLMSDMIEARSNNNASGWTPMYAESFTKQSSRKYKKDIEDITEDEAKKILDIGIVSFKYKEDKAERVHFGCIVEDVVNVIESVVTYKNEEPDGVDYSGYVPHLIKMAQIHEDVIQGQAKEITELKGTISELNERIQRLESLMLQYLPI